MAWNERASCGDMHRSGLVRRRVVRARLLTAAVMVERAPRPARTLSRRGLGPLPERAVGLLTHFTVAKLPSQVSHRHARTGSCGCRVRAPCSEEFGAASIRG